MFALTATTPAGIRLVALAEQLAEVLATHAPAHDREGSYPFASIDALRAAAYFAAPIPESQGGLGAESLHDLVVASGRLARGDASVAIGVNMHLVAVHGLVRRWRMALAAGNERRAAAFAESLAAVARDGVVMAAAISEPGQDLTRPSTVAARTASGWRVDGRKIFCTMSPAATLLYTAVGFRAADGGDRYGYAQIPADAPGVIRHDDWDALGMRASGSHSVSFEGVEIPEGALRGGFPVGHVVPYMERNLAAGLFHASASLGIAEAADAVAGAAAARRGRDAEARTRTLVAENAIDLTACRATLARAAAMIDEHHGANPESDGTDDEIVALFTHAQAAKAFVNEAASRVVDRGLALSGGAGYRSGHPLARASRDVRAGGFMHPLGTTRAYELIGDMALGLEPALN